MTLYQRSNLRFASMFFATAEQESESIRALGFKQPIAVVPNGIYYSVDGHQLRGRINTANSPHVALFLSRIHPKKGLLNLLDAWARIRPADWHLRLAGPDESGHLADVMRRAADLGIGGSVEYIGEVTDAEKGRTYASADLFILPTFSENFGVSVAEALSYGLPVITTTGAPWKELIHRSCGWWVDPTADALAHALREATSTDLKTLHAMGERGRDYAKTFHWPNIARQTLDVYRWLLGGDQMPSFVRMH